MYFDINVALLHLSLLQKQKFVNFPAAREKDRDCKSQATSPKQAIRVKRDQLRPQVVSFFFLPRDVMHVTSNKKNTHRETGLVNRN